MKKISLIICIFLFVSLLFGQDFETVKKSAEQGFAEAQFFLGRMYLFGEGTLMDKKQAAYWIKKAYQNGYADAKEVWNKWELWKY